MTAGTPRIAARLGLVWLAALAGPACLGGPADLRPAVAAPLAARALTLGVAPAAEGRWIAVGERGHVLLRTRPDAPWHQLPAPADETLTAVAFSPDGMTGLAVGHGGIVLRSRDGGMSWQVAFRAADPLTVYLDVCWAGPTRAFVAGAYGRLLWTEDAGESFSERVFLDEMHLNRVGYVPEAGSLFLAGESGLLLRSEDDGQSWNPLSPPYDGSLFLFLPLADGGILVGGLRGHLFRSQDGGETWVDFDPQVTSLLAAAASSADGQTIVIVASGGPGLVSHDGGRTFAPLPLPAAMAGVAWHPAGFFTAVGAQGPVDLQLPPSTPAPE